MTLVRWIIRLLDWGLRAVGICGIALWHVAWFFVECSVKIAWSAILGIIEGIFILFLVIFWKRL